MSTNANANPSQQVKFEGSAQYVATDDLKLAVNAARTLQRRC